MGYNNESRKTKSIDNRNRIVEAALRLIDEKGFDNVTVSQITEAAGVSKGAFYIHFKSKEELIEQQISELYDEFKLDQGLPKFERLSYFLLNSIKAIIPSKATTSVKESSPMIRKRSAKSSWMKLSPRKSSPFIMAR